MITASANGSVVFSVACFMRGSTPLAASAMAQTRGPGFVQSAAREYKKESRAFPDACVHRAL